MNNWRVGRKVPINVYEGERPVCQCQTAADAMLIVKAVNRYMRGDGLVPGARRAATDAYGPSASAGKGKIDVFPGR